MIVIKIIVILAILFVTIFALFPPHIICITLFKILPPSKGYIGNKLNKVKRTQLQNASWFNEKSRNNINVLQDITHFLNNSINNLEKGDISPNSPLSITITNRKSLLKDLINAKTPKRKSAGRK